MLNAAYSHSENKEVCCHFGIDITYFYLAMISIVSLARLTQVLYFQPETRRQLLPWTAVFANLLWIYLLEPILFPLRY